MQAIQTKYHGPTNINGSRFTARCDAGRVTVGYDHGLNVAENHVAAARALMVKLGWAKGDNASMQIVSGQLPDGSWAHVFHYPTCAWKA